MGENIFEHYGVKTYGTVTILENTNREIAMLIDEAIHSFPGQYDIAKKCAAEVVEAMKTMSNKCVVDASDIDSNFKKIEISINYDNNDFQTSGSLINMDGNGYFLIFLNVGMVNRIEGNKYKFSDIVSTISHELMHSEIFQKRYDKSEELNDRPENYDSVVSVMRNSTDIISSKYARALYSTYYHERQSLISQAWPEFKESMKIVDKIFDTKVENNLHNNEYFKLVFGQTDVSRTFRSNIEVCDEIRYYGETCLETIIREFRKYGDNTISPDTILKSLKTIREKSEFALKRAMNNAYVNWMENKETNNK